jgi:glycosyltransferase involved in cell wall biosynthesis
MKIALINNLFEPFSRGGAERVVYLQKKGLEESGHKVIVISLKPDKRTVSAPDNQYYIKSTFAGLNQWPKFFRLFWHLGDLFNLFKGQEVLKILEKEKVDLVISHNLTGLGKISAWLIAKKYRHVHFLHDINLLHPSGLMYLGNEGIISSLPARFYQGILKKFFSPTYAVISPSRWLMDLHIQHGFFKLGVKTLALPNPVEEVMIKKISDDKRSVNFIYIGLLDQHKGIDVLLEAWRQLQKDATLNNYYITLIGECQDLEISRKIREIPNLKYLGKLKHNELYEHLMSADALIMPSICYENSPTVIYEAASCGVLPIASAIGGAKELTDSLGGITFAPNNKSDLAEKMSWVIKNNKKARQQGLACRDRVAEFSLSTYMEKLRNEEII